MDGVMATRRMDGAKGPQPTKAGGRVAKTHTGSWKACPRGPLGPSSTEHRPARSPSPPRAQPSALPPEAARRLLVQPPTNAPPHRRRLSMPRRILPRILGGP
eukprot:scaffold234_cov406-Prasinococcus_capsulatus_cf.AAC.17